MSRNVDYNDFLVKKNVPQLSITYITSDLSYVDKDAPNVIAQVSSHQDGNSNYSLKRTVANKFYNPWDIPHPRDDIKYNDESRSPRWVKVSKICFEKYIEFLQSGSRVALTQAEREYNFT